MFRSIPNQSPESHTFKGDGLPVGKRGLVAYKRVGGDVSDVDAFRLLKA